MADLARAGEGVCSIATRQSDPTDCQGMRLHYEVRATVSPHNDMQAEYAERFGGISAPYIEMRINQSGMYT